MKKQLENLSVRTELSTQFNIPLPNFLKNHCKKDDYLKVIATGERFWVSVLEDVHDENNIPCEITNTLLNKSGHGFQKGDIISVKRENVFDYLFKDSPSI